MNNTWAKHAVYLLGIHFENAYVNGTGQLWLKSESNEITKWTFLPSGSSSRELLRLIAATCGGTSLLPHLPFELQRLCRRPDNPLQVELVLTLHPSVETPRHAKAYWGSGIRIDEKGVVRSLSGREYRFLSNDIPSHRAKTGIGDSWFFLLGYGPVLKHHDLTDDFDFTDPFFRLTRFHSLFLKGAPLTDPVEFLTRIHYRGVRHKRLPPTHVLERLSRLLKQYFAIDTQNWMKKECDFGRQWRVLTTRQQRAVLPILDAARHLLDAYPKHVEPLDLPFLLLFDRPDQSYPEELFPEWAGLMDSMFPEAQFLVTVADKIRHRFPSRLLTRSLKLPIVQERSSRPPPRGPQGAILLLDVDGRLPNLALMKLSRFFKEQGRRVILARHDALASGVEAVYASCVFSLPASQRRVLKLRKYYGDSLVLGGSGVDIAKRLPKEVEILPADYSLYPELGQRAIGFITRGCPFQCPFCIVPRKEGKLHQVSNLDELLLDGRRELLLLDDNILAHPRAGDFLEEMAARDLKVNFTQTLDLRLLDQEKVQLLKRIQSCNLKFTRRVYHFSLNDGRNLDEVNSKYHLFDFTSKDNVEFICMYGFNTTLVEDVERFSFLRSLPGAYVFMQKYQPILGGPPSELADFFDERADELINRLIRIIFTQNMKSMEKYYRWVSMRYAQTFGKLHQGLVDTIFRYNNRQKRGLYMATITRRCGS